MMEDDDFLAISGIQHFCFCRRQWALIHIEQQWQENLQTVQGEILHEKTHNSYLDEKRNDIIISRGMSVCSRELGISGVCDVVEFHKDENGITVFGREGRYIPIPVEYKRGKPKKDNCDILQLTAQAICLEEMLLCKIDSGFLYYGEIKHRQEVLFTPEIRKQLVDVVNEMHSYFDRKYTPKVKTSKKCDSCSLNEICLPELCSNISVKEYFDEFVGRR